MERAYASSQILSYFEISSCTQKNRQSCEAFTGSLVGLLMVEVSERTDFCTSNSRLMSFFKGSGLIYLQSYFKSHSDHLLISFQSVPSLLIIILLLLAKILKNPNPVSFSRSQLWVGQMGSSKPGLISHHPFVTPPRSCPAVQF